jgi:hypothetical protein
MKRPVEVSAAAVILILAAIASIVFSVMNTGSGMPGVIPAGAGPIPAGGPNPEQIANTMRNVGIGLMALNLVVSLLAAFGLWRLSKWGYWLALILSVLKILGGVPMFINRAMPISPETFGQIAVGLIVLIFLLLKESREAFFPER